MHIYRLLHRALQRAVIWQVRPTNPAATYRFTDDYIAFTRRVIVREIQFHDLRHTHASELLRRGMPLKIISQRLGHANPSVTLNIYAQVMSGDDENAAETVEDIYRQRSNEIGKEEAK